jgi:8-oxo-dGTP pyrophosphatase MutT (NUDIX family)
MNTNDHSSARPSEVVLFYLIQYACMHIRESAGGIVVGKDGKMILVEQGGNSWSFPKGGIDPGESALEAAKREIAEECGITKLTLVASLGSYERYSIAKDGVSDDIEHGLRKRTLFLFFTPQETLSADGIEITAVRWVTFDEAFALLTHSKDKEFLASVRKKVEEKTSEVR